MYSFGGRPRERIQILLWFIQSSLLSKLWVRCFSLGYLNILFLWWPFPDIPNEGNWWVRDRLLPSFSEEKKGSSWLQVILLSYGLFRTESEWGVRDFSLPSFSDNKALLRLVWLVSLYVYLWWWRCWIWACSIFLSEHGSETRHGKRPEPRTTLCLLEYDCGANALG